MGTVLKSRMFGKSAHLLPSFLAGGSEDEVEVSGLVGLVGRISHDAAHESSHESSRTCLAKTVAGSSKRGSSVAQVGGIKEHGWKPCVPLPQTGTSGSYHRPQPTPPVRALGPQYFPRREAVVDVASLQWPMPMWVCQVQHQHSQVISPPPLPKLPGPD